MVYPISYKTCSASAYYSLFWGSFFMTDASLSNSVHPKVRKIGGLLFVYDFFLLFSTILRKSCKQQGV